MKNLLITGSNSNYFAETLHMLGSFRSSGNEAWDVVVCDNKAVEHRRKNKCKLYRKGTFSKDETQMLTDLGCKVISIHTLIEQNGIDWERLKKCHSEHRAHPLKFVYMTLLSRDLAEEYEMVAFSDIDIFYQGDLNRVIGDLGPNIGIAAETRRIGQNNCVSRWMRGIRMPSKTLQSDYLNSVLPARNLCTGFIAGAVRTFNKFSELCWNLSEASSFRFHSDQPIANYVVHHLQVPYTLLDESDVCHLALRDDDDLHIEKFPLRVMVEGNYPTVVHYHGHLNPTIRRYISDL